MKLRWCFALLGAALNAGCHHDVRLEFPEADAVSATYECTTTKGPEKCVASTVVDPASENRLGTEFVMMPKECQKHFHRIVIHDAGSASPTAHVECAPPEGTIPPLTPITAPPAPPGGAAGAPSAAPGDH